MTLGQGGGSAGARGRKGLSDGSVCVCVMKYGTYYGSVLIIHLGNR